MLVSSEVTWHGPELSLTEHIDVILLLFDLLDKSFEVALLGDIGRAAAVFSVSHSTDNVKSRHLTE